MPHRLLRPTILALAALVLFCPAALAHFQMILPSPDLVTADSGRTVHLDLRFTHPMADGPVMEMGKPRRFGVFYQGKRHDLRQDLVSRKLQGKTAFQADFAVVMPADYVFYLEPAPYWEPAEGKMIIHYTKVVVDAYDAGQGWDAMVGLPVEIEPLVRPYGLWTGNLFQGVVKRNGVPVPFAEVEVEYYNPGRKVAVPADPYQTQVIKADQNGVFSYAMPRSGWWGFAALVEGEKTMANPAGKQVPVELGGLIWVRTRDMIPARQH